MNENETVGQTYQDGFNDGVAQAAAGILRILNNNIYVDHAETKAYLCAEFSNLNDELMHFIKSFGEEAGKKTEQILEENPL